MLKSIESVVDGARRFGMKMNKKQETYLSWRQVLDRAGWDVDKQDAIKFNSGSETARHQHAKLATARVLKHNEYRIDTELTHPSRGEIDCVAIPTQADQKPFAVELEHSPTRDVVEDKLERYYNGTPFTEVFVLNLNDAPLNCIDLEMHIADELGLEV